MPITTPTRAEIINRMRTDVKAELPESDPFNQSGTINAELVAFGGRVREVYDQVEIVSRDTFVSTAEGQSLLDRASIQGLSLLNATQSEGLVTFTGSAGSLIPQGTEVRSQSGLIYNTQNSLTLQPVSLSVFSLTRIGVVATLITSSESNISTGMPIIISGSDQPEYNGTFTVTVTDTDTFTFNVEGSPTTPATGTMLAEYSGGTITVKSEGTGQTQNLSSGAQVNLSATIAGVDDVGFVGLGGVDGGTDEETTEELRERTLFKMRNPATPFNVANITIEAQKVAGVTRVFVYEAEDLPQVVTPTSIIASAGFVIVTFPLDHNLLTGMKISISGASVSGFNGTFRGMVISDTEFAYFVSGLSGTASGTLVINYPLIQLGQVAVYFVRDNDPNIIPSASEVSKVAESIEAIRPANTAPDDVLVRAPIPVNSDFIISVLSPDTIGIRNSIDANLNALFSDSALGENITEAQYVSAVQSSFDPETNSQVKTFSLNISGDIPALFNEIHVLNSISYA